MSPNDGRRGGNIVKPHSTTWGLGPLTSQPRPTSRVGSTNKRAKDRLLTRRCMLPGPSVLERLIIRVCSTAHLALFESIYQHLSPELRDVIEAFLKPPEGEQRSPFYELKAYPPSASISSLQRYLKRYAMLSEAHLEQFQSQSIDPAFLDYLFKMARRYSAKDGKRFNTHKRYAVMICFLLETRKVLLDHLVKMHDQYITDLCRHSRLAHEKQHRLLRKRQKRAIDTVLTTTHTLLDWPDDEPLTKTLYWQRVDEQKLRDSLEDLRAFKHLEERGYGALLLARYPSMRKYFGEFIQLPFAAERGSDNLLEAIDLIRKLDSGELKHLPANAPTEFVPMELRHALKDRSGNLSRNAWEMGLSLAVKDAFRSGDLYLPALGEPPTENHQRQSAPDPHRGSADASRPENRVYPAFRAPTTASITARQILQNPPCGRHLPSHQPRRRFDECERHRRQR